MTARLTSVCGVAGVVALVWLGAACSGTGDTEAVGERIDEPLPVFDSGLDEPTRESQESDTDSGGDTIDVATDDAATPTPLGTPTPLPTPTAVPAAAEGGPDTDSAGGDASEAEDPDADPTDDPLVAVFCEADSSLIDTLDALDVAEDEDFEDVLALTDAAFEVWRDASPRELSAAVTLFLDSWTAAAAGYTGPDDIESTRDDLNDWYFSDTFERAVTELDDWILGNCP